MQLKDISPDNPKAQPKQEPKTERDLKKHYKSEIRRQGKTN
jgi:hypothetical protein